MGVNSNSSREQVLKAMLAAMVAAGAAGWLFERLLVRPWDVRLNFCKGVVPRMAIGGANSVSVHVVRT